MPQAKPEIIRQQSSPSRIQAAAIELRSAAFQAAAVVCSRQAAIDENYRDVRSRIAAAVERLQDGI